DAPQADYDVPMQAFSFVSELVVLDHRTGTAILIAATLNDGVDDENTLWDDAQRRLDDLQSGLAQPSETWLAEVDLGTEPEPIPRTARDDFLAAVERSREYIREGDVFQVV